MKFKKYLREMVDATKKDPTLLDLDVVSSACKAIREFNPHVGCVWLTEHNEKEFIPKEYYKDYIEKPITNSIKI